MGAIILPGTMRMYPMPERKRKPTEPAESNLGLEGFEKFFDAATEKAQASATAPGESGTEVQLTTLLGKFGELISLTVDQRVETAKIANQLIENQRQLIATQQILIRLMEKSIELTRHITGIEEKLPAVFELPRIVEGLRSRVAHIEGIEVE
jgi:hypothetical protein